MNSAVGHSCKYLEEGYEILDFLTLEEFELVKSYALEMLFALFKKYGVSNLSDKRLSEYHQWCDREKVPHSEILKARNRHTIPPDAIKELLLNDRLASLLSRIGIEQNQIWDEGLGWLGFRLIRPGFGDGYPFSCKSWGPAKNVISVWLPIVGFSPYSMINLMPKSHRKEYPMFLPKESKFTKDEYRLDYQPASDEQLRPVMQEGQALLFHPKTIHSEEVTKSKETRFNLEFRIEPILT